MVKSSGESSGKGTKLMRWLSLMVDFSQVPSPWDNSFLEAINFDYQCSTTLYFVTCVLFLTKYICQVRYGYGY